MKQTMRWIPVFLIFVVAMGMLIYGPIAQLDHYHEFADGRTVFGIPNAADVFSNIGFAVVGLYGLWCIWDLRRSPSTENNLLAAQSGYCLFLFALILTAFGSTYYHLAPDNQRLLWDRIPIALACTGLLAAMRAETHVPDQSIWITVLLAASGIASVLWWSYTESVGVGDLRPYLLIQGAPLVLIPIWQALYGSSRRARLLFTSAILLYIVAKVVEVNDHQILSMLGFVSGHTLKHLLATAAGAVLTVHMVSQCNRVQSKQNAVSGAATC